MGAVRARLKTLEDATTIRRRILMAFERAERETDPQRRAARLTFVIVGAGPTGVELAGTIAELAACHNAGGLLQHRHLQGAVPADRGRARVLAGFPEDLSAYAQRSVESLGVEVVLGQPVSECAGTAWFYGGQQLAAKDQSSGPRVCVPRPRRNGSTLPADRAGRLPVLADLTVPGHPEIFACWRHRDHCRPRWPAGSRHPHRRPNSRGNTSRK